MKVDTTKLCKNIDLFLIPYLSVLDSIKINYSYDKIFENFLSNMRLVFPSLQCSPDRGSQLLDLLCQ